MRPRPDSPSEIELKLRLPEGGAAALERVPAFGSVAADERYETTRYFDTPELTLDAHGFTLRVRSSGYRCVQTLKTAHSTGGAATQRGEWEWPVEGGKPALDLLAGTPAADLAPLLERRLEPVFTAEVQRRARILRIGEDTEIEAAQDRGRIWANDAQEDVDELELELKQGRHGALYRLAIQLHEVVPMRLAPESKAARGYRLRTGRLPKAVHSPKIRLDCDVRANEAFRAIVAGSLGGILANLAAAEAAAPEGIHQFRVGLRRLRSALVLFQPMLEPHALQLFSAELRRLGRVFGERRDRDVFCLETLPALAEAGFRSWADELRGPAERDRDAAHGAVLEALRGPGLTSLALGLAAWCEDGIGEPRLLGGRRWGKRLGAVLPSLLDRLARTVAKRAKRLDEPERLHDLRKSLKKLRYATEFASGLYEAKPVQRYRKRCEALQEQLGTLNDAAVTPLLAERLIDERNLELAPAVAALSAWSATRHREGLAGLDRSLRRFAKADPFWR